MGHPSDPVETPPPASLGRYGSDHDGSIGEPSPAHAVCLHPELINVVRQAEKRRLPLTVAVIAATVTVVLAIAGVLYSQGSAAGATAVRVEALEARAREDRVEQSRGVERQRQDATDAAQRDTQILQAIHGLDSRMGRIEERLTPQR
jgi:hypothetical protein